MEAAAFKSNSLRVSFPGQTGVTFAVAHDELSVFGDIALLELPPCADDNAGVAIVSYYDVRAAERATAVLGLRCTAAAAHGERCVQIPWGVGVDVSMLSDVATVRYDETLYTVVFYDIRAAARALAAADGARVAPMGAVSGAPARAGRMAATGTGNVPLSASQRRAADAVKQWVGPRYVNSLRISEVNWADIASGLDTRTTLRLRGLPRELSVPGALEQMLASAKLLDLVDCVHVQPPREGARLGSAVVNVTLPQHVPAVARFFHGKQVAGRGLMAVSFATVQGAEALRRKVADLTKPWCPAVPWRIEAEYERHEGSQTSTQAGSDEDADSGPDTSPEPPSEPRRLILPPPGLEGTVRVGRV